MLYACGCLCTHDERRPVAYSRDEDEERVTMTPVRSFRGTGRRESSLLPPSHGSYLIHHTILTGIIIGGAIRAYIYVHHIGAAGAIITRGGLGLTRVCMCGTLWFSWGLLVPFALLVVSQNQKIFPLYNTRAGRAFAHNLQQRCWYYAYACVGAGKKLT